MWTVNSVCEALLLDENTVYRYYAKYQAEGLAGLLDNNYKGRPEQLTAVELKALDNHLQEQLCRTTKEVIYSSSGMDSLLKRLGYRYKKPRVILGKADVKAQLA